MMNWKGLALCLGLLAAGYLLICLFLYLRQTRFMFFPERAITVRPSDFGLNYEEVWLPVGQSGSTERLHGWWIPAQEPAAGVLLYLHGNGINIGANAAQASRFQQLGLSVLLIDYRGYGQSEGGFPNEQQVYQDAEASWQYLTQVRQIAPEAIVIYGHSLGGAIGIQLANQHPDAAALIVESSFTSMRQMVNCRPLYRLFPIDLLLTQRFDSLSRVPRLQMPVLLIHGLADGKVPAAMSQMLYDVSPQPKQLYWVPLAGHNDVAETAGEAYGQTVAQFLSGRLAGSSLTQVSAGCADVGDGADGACSGAGGSSVGGGAG